MSEFHFRYSYPSGALVSFWGGHLKYIYNFNLNLNPDFPNLWFQWTHSWYCFSCFSVTVASNSLRPQGLLWHKFQCDAVTFCKNSFTCPLAINPLPVASLFVALIGKSEGRSDSVTCSTRGSLLSGGLLPWGGSMWVTLWNCSPGCHSWCHTEDCLLEWASYRDENHPWSHLKETLGLDRILHQ